MAVLKAEGDSVPVQWCPSHRSANNSPRSWSSVALVRSMRLRFITVVFQQVACLVSHTRLSRTRRRTGRHPRGHKKTPFPVYHFGCLAVFCLPTFADLNDLSRTDQIQREWSMHCKSRLENRKPDFYTRRIVSLTQVGNYLFCDLRRSHGLHWQRRTRA